VQNPPAYDPVRCLTCLTKPVVFLTDSIALGLCFDTQHFEMLRSAHIGA
jgi:hypothetical protein